MDRTNHRLHGPIPPERAQRRDWFAGLKFGVFVHWGVEAGHGKCRHVSPEQARKIGEEFDRNATGFDPDEWLDVFERAGARYVVFTAKHGHDFFLYPSEVNSFHSRRDYVGELAQVCGERGMPLFLYLNLNSFGLLNLAETGCSRGKLAGQQHLIALTLREYCERYRPAGIWLDAWPTCVDRLEKAGLDPSEVFDFEALAGAVRECDENILIGNKALFPPHTDFLTSESMFTTHFGDPLARPDAPTETADTLPGSGWFSTRQRQERFLTDDEIEAQSVYYLKRLVSAVGNGSNYLLDTGPLRDGSLQDVETRILQNMGDWLAQNGDAVYRAQPMSDGQQDWGYGLRKNGNVYLHVIDNTSLVRAQDCSRWDPCLQQSGWETHGMPASGRLHVPCAWAENLAENEGEHLEIGVLGNSGEECYVKAENIPPDPVSQIISFADANPVGSCSLC
jgi:alpha-L-fucosidase